MAHGGVVGGREHEADAGLADAAADALRAQFEVDPEGSESVGGA
jgi:hypothetical protein